MLRRRLPVAVLVVMAVAILAFAQSEAVPAYNQGPPKKGVSLAAIVPKDQRVGESYSMKYQQVAYDVAQKIPGVLYQLPCYCHCDRIGHNSLRTCFESAHAAHCTTCMKEAYFAYFETKKGRMPKQIRAEITKGDWRNLDLDQAAAKASKM